MTDPKSLQKWADEAFARWCKKRGLRPEEVQHLGVWAHSWIGGDVELPLPANAAGQATRKGERNMSKALRNKTAIVREAMAYSEQEKRRLLADTTISDEYRAQQIGMARRAGYEAGHRAAREGMGKNGVFWLGKQAAQDAYRAALDAAEIAAIPDPQRVLLAAQRLPAILRSCPNPAAYRAWWEGASTSERLAMAYDDGNLLRQTGWVEAGSLAAQAREFRAQRLNTADLQAAQVALDDWDDAGIEHANTIQEAADVFGDAATIPIFHIAGAEDTFAAIRANVERSDSGDWTLAEPRVYKTPVVSGGNAPEGGAPAE